MIDTEELANRLLDAREAYYESDSPLMSDEDFDSLEELLRKQEPNHEYFKRVGYLGPEADSGGKIRHRVPMLSMGKVKNLQGAEKWLRRLKLQPPYTLAVQPKIDGLSASLAYADGRLSYVATRGDGEVGQDITHIAAYVKDIPEEITFTKEHVEIRGELHLPRDTEYDTGNRPLRNNCIGLINRKGNRKKLLKDLKYVRFLAYQIIWPEAGHSISGATAAPQSVSKTEPRFNSEFGKIDILAESGFYTFEKWLLTPDGPEDTHIEQLIHKFSLVYQDFIGGLRNQWNYETDGLIIVIDDNLLHDGIDEHWVVEHHHHYSLAYKPPSEAVQTTLRNVTWQVSRQGSLTPVAHFEPVYMGGATLERANLHNAENVRRLRLSLGDSILVERANDVIPHVRRNLDGDARLENFLDPHIWPESCPSCESALIEVGVHITCPNSECRDRVLQSILYWVRQAEMEYIALRTLEALYDTGKLRRIQDLYTLTKEDLVSLEGFGKKKTANFLEQITHRKPMSPMEFIGRLGIPMVQERSLVRLGITSMEDFMNFDDESSLLGKRIVEWKSTPGNLSLLEELLEVVRIEERSGSVERKGVLCLTGKAPMPRKTLIAALERAGWVVADTVTRNTVKVVCDDPGGSSAKLKKSREAGIEIVTYDEFLGEEDLLKQEYPERS